MASGSAPTDIYAERLAERRLRISTVEAKLSRIHYLRLFVFAALAFVIWRAIRSDFPVWSIAVPVAAFILLVVVQSRLERDAECLRRAALFHERGIARVAHQWQDVGATGDRFADHLHPYSSDLDIFGRASLFQLLSTARTGAGEARLAAWLKAPASFAELRLRHDAIVELRPLLDLRERIAILGEDYRSGVNPDELARWAAAAPQPFPAWMRAAALALSGIALFMLGWQFFSEFQSGDALTGLLITGLAEALLWATIRTRVNQSVEIVGHPARDLDLLSKILAELEACEFQSPLLATLRDKVRSQSGAASAAINALRRLMELLDSRDNLLVRGLGPAVLWTTQIAMAIEAWRVAHGADVAGWLDSVAELEALSSLANYSWEHPDDPLPEFIESGQPEFIGESLGHPLLNDSRCIRNSVSLAHPRRLIVVSGSNMSGKSTLLRAVGVNTVLALAGAPVRAQRLALSHVSLGASIRTVDSLEEGHSRFMAEILRLKQIAELPEPALFLLDELLGGTNSHDRAVGSLGLIRALLEKGGIGLVTTHDLSLARVADELGAEAANVHFEDRVEDGRLVFDYRMREGVVTRSNALDLMRAVGLDV